MRPHKKSKNDFGDIEAFDESDITGSDDDLSDSDRRLLEKVRKKHAPAENYDSDDEVLGVANDDDEHSSMDSDIDEPQDDDDLPDERAWGKKKKDYYSADYVDPDYSTATHKDTEKAELEEQEARKIQMRLAEQLDDADFCLDLIQTSAEQDDEADQPAVEIIPTDLSKMSVREKRAMFHRENPEFQPLISDVINRLEEMKNILCPFVRLARREKFANSSSIKLLTTKYSLTLNYCTNVSFYLMLKAKKIPTRTHPVIKRLAQYRIILNQIEEKQGDLLKEASNILEAHQSEKQSLIISTKTQSKAKKTRKQS